MKSTKVEPKIKDILRLIGVGSAIAATFIVPGIPLLAKPFLAEKRRQEELEWKKYNTWRLRQLLKRLKNQKMVEIIESESGPIVKISDRGKRKLLQYNLEDLQLIHKKWDHKWRIIAYDVDESKKSFRKSFQVVLKKLKFLQLQQSVYLTPFPCEDEIEFLRQIHGIGSEVAILTITGLENEQVYKEYFGLK